MKTLVVAAVCLVVLISCSLCTPAKPWNDGNGHWLTVQTSNGPVTGHPAPNATQVIEYLGIPFAQPPVGSLRFAPPLPYTGSGPYVAAEWVSQCLFVVVANNSTRSGRVPTVLTHCRSPSKASLVRRHKRTASWEGVQILMKVRIA